MSESEEVTKLKAEIAQLRKHLVRHHQLTDAPLLKNYEPYKSLNKPTQDDFNAVLDDLRRKGASIDGDNAYKRDLCDAVVGALAMGAQNSNSPPAGHWGQRFWDIGRGEAEAREELIAALKLNRENLRACQATIHLCGGFDPAYVNDAQAAMKVADEALAKFST
ncbi:hypothetical protein [Pseudomonas sp. 31 R 17]|uniref:hypothetical protein n=1 Tax=Pseudomonas sp. 31 R 17 TaxID=1844101 RepID=UPI00081289FC|nr:hypothetical protein [Pseudomonas sp. 31 R 17]CRM70542.1 hypothetical protein [Pseudomonas sp. 31 R 17]